MATDYNDTDKFWADMIALCNKDTAPDETEVFVF